MISRHETGEIEIHNDLLLFDMELFFRYFRMSLTKFEEFICMVGLLIAKVLKLRSAIKANKKLCFTFRHLVTRDSQIIIVIILFMIIIIII